MSQGSELWSQPELPEQSEPVPEGEPLPSYSEDVRLLRFECDYCEIDITRSRRFRCGRCEDFDVCEPCYLKRKGTADAHEHFLWDMGQLGSVKRKRRSPSPEHTTNDPVFGGRDSESLTVQQLKELCFKCGLRSTGPKATLVERLQNFDPYNRSALVKSKANRQKLTSDQVHMTLRAAGVERPKEANPCLKAALTKGYCRLPLVVDDPLGMVVAKGKCEKCGVCNTVTVGELAEQPSEGDLEDKAVKTCVCGAEVYVVGFCLGKPHLQAKGGLVKHCMKCPEFGMCVKGVEIEHCEKCGTHYDISEYSATWQGCPTCYRANRAFTKAFDFGLY